MGNAVIRGGVDAWVGAGAPNQEHPRTRFLRVDSGQRESFVYLRSPVPPGATVTSAVLRFVVRDSDGSARTLTCRRVGEKWGARRTNWKNKPGTTGTAATYSLPAGHQRDHVVEFDVTSHVQSVANGDEHYGWKITSDSTDLLHLYSLQAGREKPVLEVEWSDAPSAPTSLTPSEGAVSVSHPTLQFDYTDVSGATELAAVQVQIDPASDEVTPAFDSGEVATTDPEMDLGGTAYAGLTDGETTSWRVRVKDEAGLWSEWSEWAVLTRTAKGTVSITNPADIADPYVSEPTPAISWTFSGVQTAWMVSITNADARGSVLYTSGKRPGTETAHTLPEGVLKDSRNYSVSVRVWDDQDREATPGDPVFSAAWRDFVMSDDAGTAGVESLTGSVVADAPWVDLTWTRSTAPDAFAVYRDEVVVEVLDPTDVLVDGQTTEYAWRDSTADPYREHTWSVRAVVNGSQSTDEGLTYTATTAPVGIWLSDLERGVTVVFAGDDEGTWTMPDEASVYTPVGSEEAVRIVGGLRGYEGGLSGDLIDGFQGKTFAQQEADLWSIKERPSQKVRLIVGDVSLPVLIGNLSVAPRPITRKGGIVKGVSFDFWQVGGLQFEPRL